jgi:transcriptional regulator
MYSPAHFQKNNADALLGLIAAHPLATVVCHSDAGLVADHMPLMHVAAAPGHGHGQLIGHVARANPLWQLPSGQDVLVVFQGPSSYISPGWYATKAATGRVVPTWNYAVVHAHCTLTAIEEPDRALEIITQLTDWHEAAMPHPWRVADAPQDFTDSLLSHIVGIALQIHRLEGKWKVSQNQPEANRRSVAQALAQGSPAQADMAALVQASGKVQGNR